MTWTDFACLPWRKSGHSSWEWEFCSIYDAEKDGHHFSYCTHTPVHKGRSFTHYKVDGKIYKTREKLLEAIKEL